MSHTPNHSRAAHLVMSVAENEKVPSHYEQIGSYQEIYSFVDAQGADAHIEFKWHYLDPLLRRKLALATSRRAIQLEQTHLTIEQFTVDCQEIYQENHSEKMSRFMLNASGIFEPRTPLDMPDPELDLYIRAGIQDPTQLYEAYDARRAQEKQRRGYDTSPQPGQIMPSGSADASIRELGDRPPAA